MVCSFNIFIVKVFYGPKSEIFRPKNEIGSWTLIHNPQCTDPRPQDVSRARELSLSLLALNKKEKPENLKFFYGPGHRTRACKARRYIFPPWCCSIHSRWHRYSGTNNTIYLYFSPINYLFIYIHQSMWQMFSVGPAFKGIQMIPLTSHFLFYTSS